MDCAAHLQALGLTVEPLATRLRREPKSRKAVLAEGRALLTYVLREPPGRALLARYARVIGVDGPLKLPGIVRRLPRLLRIIEAFAQGSPLARRLEFALALGEASPEGERVLGRGGRGTRLLRVGFDVALDLVLLPIRIACLVLRGQRS
jgi:hypothetical protein